MLPALDLDGVPQPLILASFVDFALKLMNPNLDPNQKFEANQGLEAEANQELETNQELEAEASH